MTQSYKIITGEEADTLFNIKQYEFVSYVEYDAIVLFEGDTVFDETFTDQHVLKTLLSEEQMKTFKILIIINGNLTETIVGYGTQESEPLPVLLVLGDLHCDELNSVDDYIHITGDAHIKYLFDGNYNHGAIRIEGITHSPYILNSDHQSDITPSDSAVVINYYDDSDDLNCDLNAYDLPAACTFECFDMDEEEFDEIYAEDKDDLEFCRISFATVVAAGRNPFRVGVDPKNFERKD